MITIQEYIQQLQPTTMITIKQTWIVADFKSPVDPEDDPNFRYFDKLMRQKPRAR